MSMSTTELAYRDTTLHSMPAVVGSRAGELATYGTVSTEYMPAEDSPWEATSLQHYGGDLIMQAVMTPHINKEQSKHGRRLLADVVDMRGTRDRLATAAHASAEQFDTVRIAEARRIARAVNEAMWYVSEKELLERSRRSTVLDIDNIIENQQTDCFGYTLLASWYMEAASIDHYIGFANGHSVILLPTGTGMLHGMWMIDPLVLNATHNLTHSTQGSTQEEVGQRLWNMVQSQMHTYGRSAVYVDTRVIADQSGVDISTMANKYPWMLRNGGGRNRVGNGGRVAGAELLEKRSKLVLNILPMEEGRRALSATVGLKAALAEGDTARALSCVLSMKGYILDVDARTRRHPEIRQLVRNLCEQGNIADAEIAIDAYFSSYRGNEDARIAQVEGDLRRVVAEFRPDALSAAHANYALAYARSKYDSYKRKVIQPKIGKVTVGAAVR